MGLVQLQVHQVGSVSFVSNFKQPWHSRPLPLRLNAVFTPPSTSGNDSNSMAGSPSPSPKWAQKTITLPPLRRGCHLITPKVSVSYLPLPLPTPNDSDSYNMSLSLRLRKKLVKTCRSSVVALLISSVSACFFFFVLIIIKLMGKNRIEEN